MTEYEFQRQVDRLTRTYGDRHYPDERVKLLWLEMRNQSEAWFSSKVSFAISSLERAPLVSFFQKELREDNLKSWEKKKVEPSPTYDQWIDSFQSEDKKQMAQMIIKRIRNECPDEGWNSFMKMLEGMGK